MPSLITILSKLKSTLPAEQALAIALFAFLTPLQFALGGILALTVVDAICAVILAIKAKQTIESRKLRRTIGKLAIYLTVVVAAYIAESAVSGAHEAPGIMVKSLVFLITGSETKSILENCSGLMSSSERLNFWQVLLSNLQAKVQDSDASGIKQIANQATQEAAKEAVENLEKPTETPPKT